MTLWLIRAGKKAQHERKFLDDDRAYLTWDGLDTDLAKLDSRNSLRDLLRRYDPGASEKKRNNHVAQIWAYSRRIEVGDRVALPSKLSPTVHVGEVTSGYAFHANGPDPYFHSIGVKWFAREVPRDSFGQDLLYSLGSALTICQIKRNGAEQRLRDIGNDGWLDPMLKGSSAAYDRSFIDLGNDASVNDSEENNDDATDEQATTDLEAVAREAIARLVIARHKGHGLADLVADLLRAQGYTVQVPPRGPDGGVDLVAGTGPLGFGDPRLCVQVKSTSGPVDSPTLHQLLGSMQNVGATQGLLVSWGGFKSSIDRETITQFFRVRLWDRGDLLNALFEHYDRLDPDTRAALPLKRVWMLAGEED